MDANDSLILGFAAAVGVVGELPGVLTQNVYFGSIQLGIMGAIVVYALADIRALRQSPMARGFEGSIDVEHPPIRPLFESKSTTSA